MNIEPEIRRGDLAAMTTNAKPITPEDALDPSRALVPSVQRVNEVRVQKGFWPKIRRTAARIPFARQVISVWYSLILTFSVLCVFMSAITSVNRLPPAVASRPFRRRWIIKAKWGRNSKVPVKNAKKGCFEGTLSRNPA